jgi:hypothetical protein
MHFLSEELDTYVTLHSQDEPELLMQLNKETHQKILQPRMLSGHFQGRVLSMLSKIIHPATILEIGTYTGYATLCLAEGLAENGTIDTLDIEEELVDFQRKYFDRSPWANQISQHLGNALEIIPTLKKKYDGICYIPYQPQGINFRSNFSKSYIAFEPNQIKLANGINTTFDINNPDIRFDDGGEIELKLDEKTKKLMNDENNFPFNILDKKGEIIGRIELMYREDLGGYQIYSSKVKEKGKGIGKKAYIKLRQILGKPIISDSSRTEDAENLWESLERNNLSFFDEKIDKYKMYETGGNVSNTNIISQIWEWFGIKF